MEEIDKKIKLPSIVITGYIVDYFKCIKTIVDTTVTKEARVTYVPKKFAIHSSALVDYLALQNKLKEEKMAYYTYT